MRTQYDLRLTRYVCGRCRTPIDVESDSFYEFSGPDDPAFWCPACEDFPHAENVGTPAQSLPPSLPLLKGFVCHAVPKAEPTDVDSWNLLYRPYSKRSFLRQYLDWLILQGAAPICDWAPKLSVFAKFDVAVQHYSDRLDYRIDDECAGNPCEFLGMNCLKPVDVSCRVIRCACDVKGRYGLCDTGDEAMILRRFLGLSGGDHFPMLIPQASILSGKRRADFLCFVPITKFQYKKVVVLVDRPGKDPTQVSSETADYEHEGYTVTRILIDQSPSYFKLARDLRLQLENCVE